LFWLILEKTQKIFERYIFSNWICDYAWTEDLLRENDKYLAQNYNESKFLRERMLSLVALFFDEVSIGLSILNGQEYYDDCFDALNSEGKKLSFINEVKHLSSKIVSITCENDKIISPRYTEAIVKSYNLNSIILNSGAHFPIVYSQSMFFEKLKLHL